MDSPLANWNGLMMPLCDVRVSVMDRGFLFGDAVYEVIRVYHGQLFQADAHLSRLFHSLASLRISGFERTLIEHRLFELLANSGVVEGLAYIQVTRGELPRRTHRYPEHPELVSPNVLIYVDHFDDACARERQLGTSVVTYPDIRWARNDIKTTSLVGNCMAAQYAAEHFCSEVIMYDRDGLVTEGSHTSIFAVKNSTILVPPDAANVLPGITKAKVIELANQSQCKIERARIKKDELIQMDELFLAGTPEEIMPIVKVDGIAISDGKPGPIVKLLQDSFSELVNMQTKMIVGGS